jgi:adenylate kinase family enzyme
MKFKRIIIIGSPGSGKSYLSKKIAEITHYPLIHLDNEYWQPGWITTPREEWIDKQKKMISAKQWIIDGNYHSSIELRFEACDIAIFLDMNRITCILSAIRRHGKKRSDLPEYCEEKFDKEFRDFLIYIWNFPKANKQKIMNLHQTYSEKPFIIMKNRREVKKFIKTIKNECACEIQ